MARINGINSDYRMVGGKVQEVSPAPLPPPANLDLKLWICPAGSPNGLEAETGTCTGLNTTCPSAHAGHALVHLSETEGLKLVTDAGTSLQLFQNSGPNAGQIVLHPAAAKVHVDGVLELTAGGHTVTITPSAAGITVQHAGGGAVKFKSNGSLELTTGGQTVTVSGTGTALTIAHANGSQVAFKNSGGLDLVTNGGTGTVNISGNLVVSGTLTRNGSPV